MSEPNGEVWRVIEYLREDMKDLSAAIREHSAATSTLRKDVVSLHGRVGHLEQRERPCVDLLNHLDRHRSQEHSVALWSDRRWTVVSRVVAALVLSGLSAALGALGAVLAPALSGLVGG